MRPSYALAAVLLLPCLAIGWLSIAYSKQRPRPQVIIDESVDEDFAAVIQEAWAQFLSVFSARKDCFGDVVVKADYSLSDRAMYDPRTATVSVHVPQRAAILKGALIHEWAHHVEFQCDAQAEMRAAFIRAQGLPANTPWRQKKGTINLSTSDWADIPSEQYAETAVVVVLGKRPVATRALITTGGVEIVKTWAQKKKQFCQPGNWACAVVEFLRHFVPSPINQKEVPMK